MRRRQIVVLQVDGNCSKVWVPDSSSDRFCWVMLREKVNAGMNFPVS
jgi:hypothetical protein